MNIIDILHKIGYDVISFNGESIYRVMFNPIRVQRMRKNVENVIQYDFNLDDHWDIYVDEVGFNDLGNLYVSFKEIGETSNMVFDMYEYRNMKPEDLYE